MYVTYVRYVRTCARNSNSAGGFGTILASRPLLGPISAKKDVVSREDTFVSYLSH